MLDIKTTCTGETCPIKDSCLRHKLFIKHKEKGVPLFPEPPGRKIIVSYTKPAEWMCDKYIPYKKIKPLKDE